MEIDVMFLVASAIALATILASLYLIKSLNKIVESVKEFLDIAKNDGETISGSIEYLADKLGNGEDTHEEIATIEKLSFLDISRAIFSVLSHYVIPDDINLLGKDIDNSTYKEIATGTATLSALHQFITDLTRRNGANCIDRQSFISIIENGNPYEFYLHYKDTRTDAPNPYTDYTMIMSIYKATNDVLYSFDLLLVENVGHVELLKETEWSIDPMFSCNEYQTEFLDHMNNRGLTFVSTPQLFNQIFAHLRSIESNLSDTLSISNVVTSTKDGKRSITVTFKSGEFYDIDQNQIEDFFGVILSKLDRISHFNATAKSLAVTYSPIGQFNIFNLSIKLTNREGDSNDTISIRIE